MSASNYRKLLGGSAISNLGDGVSFVVIPLLAVTLTDNPALIAGLSFAYSLPRLLMSTFSGIVADRLERRRLMVAVNVVRGLILLGLAAAVALDLTTIWMLYGVFVLLGLIETLADVSAFALLPSVVPASELGRANGQLSAAQTTLDEIVGPPLGGLLLGIAVALPIAVDAATFLGAALLFWLIKGSFRPKRDEASPPSTLRAELKEGLAYLARHRTLLPLAVSGLLGTLAYMAPFSILVLYATRAIGLGPTEYGLALTVSALGSLLGAVTASPLQRLIGVRWSLRSMLLLGAVSYAVLALFTHVVVFSAMLALYFLHTSVWTICFTTWKQRLIPDQLLGRVGGAMRTFSLFGLVAGSVVGGLIASRFGLQAPFWFGAAVLVVAAVIPLGGRPTESESPSRT